MRFFILSGDAFASFFPRAPRATPRGTAIARARASH
jgi:hypothetical protein